MQNILDGEFNDREQARKYFADNIYDKYERKITELNTKASREMVDIYNRVRKIFVKPKIVSVDKESDTDTDTGLPELESEESNEQRRNQQGQRLKILTPKQMIIRLLILLGQLKAGNNSEKLKNEIRQIVYSLYRSKILSKTIYINFINTI